MKNRELRQRLEKIVQDVQVILGEIKFTGRHTRQPSTEWQSTANKRKTGKEQYYTNADVVDLCIEEVKKHVSLDGKTILEPAGGTGEFIEGLIRAGVNKEKIISYDIEPKHKLVKKGDFLKTDMSSHKNLISITNPPFGRASKLAKQFFNSSADSCDYICYIVPKSWRKWTTHNSLDKRFHLVSDIELPVDCFYVPEGTLDKHGEPADKKKGTSNTIFQIWEKREEKRETIKVPDNGLIKKILPQYLDEEKKEDRIVKGANFSIVTFGHSCGKCEDIKEDQVPYKTTTMYLKVDRQDVKDALRQLPLGKYYNNVSYVQALSIQEINYELNEHFGLKNYQF